jgi:hypothetical protein
MAAKLKIEKRGDEILIVHCFQPIYTDYANCQATVSLK